MKSIWIISLVVFICIISCSSTETSEEFGKIFRRFNRKLYRALSKIERGNFVYSPFSLHMVLTMAYLVRKILVTKRFYIFENELNFIGGT